MTCCLALLKKDILICSLLKIKMPQISNISLNTPCLKGWKLLATEWKLLPHIKSPPIMSRHGNPLS